MNAEYYKAYFIPGKATKKTIRHNLKSYSLLKTNFAFVCKVRKLFVSTSFQFIGYAESERARQWLREL